MIYVSLLDLQSVATTSETHIYINYYPFVTIVQLIIILMSGNLTGPLKSNIQELVADNMTVEQTFPELKSVNIANNYTEIIKFSSS